VGTGFFNSAESAVTCAATAAEVLLFVRLAWLGLLREFKIFSIFLAFDAALTVFLSRWDYHSYGYEWVWAISAPVWTLLLSAASLELWWGLRQPFPQETGNRTVGLYGFLIGMTVSAVTSMLAHPQVILRSAVLFTIISRRCILSGCILGILAQGVYLALGRAPLVANWRLHRRILLMYMTAIVIASFAAPSSLREYAEWINLSRVVSLCCCFCVWIVGLRPAFRRLDSWIPSEMPTDAQLAELIVFNRGQATLSLSPLRMEVGPHLLPDTEG
jgi:hypothetical protein